MGYNLDVSKLSKDDWEYYRCRERSLYILQNYSKTEKQLRDKLKDSKKYKPETIDKVMSFLKEHHFIDDVAYTDRFIETHKNHYSKKVIKEKLYIKGIKKDIIDSAFNNDEIEFDESSIIKKLLFKKCPDYKEKKDSMDIKERQKLFAFLYRKGFRYDDIMHVMNED